MTATGTKEKIDRVLELLDKLVSSDWIEIGTPGKGGAIKVHVNFDDPDYTINKIKLALEIRAWAEEEYIANRIKTVKKEVKDEVQ